MTLDVLLYICIYVCGCILIFDFIFAVSVWRQRYLGPKRVRYIMEYMIRYHDTADLNARLDALYLKALESRLLNEYWLLAYLQAYQELEQDQHLDISIVQVLNIKLFRRLAEKIADKPDDTKALFSHVVYEIIPARHGNESVATDYRKLSKVLISFLNSKSIFVRSNAFRAVTKICTSISGIFYALTILDQHLHLLSSRIFGDYLLQFGGDIIGLITLLLHRLSSFSSNLQVMIINFMRYLPRSVDQSIFYHRLLTYLETSNIHGEIAIAIIRYFSKHAYPYVYPCIMKYAQMDEDRTSNYNYAAVAVSALRNYPGDETVQLLIQKLGSNDWYVRFNSADSLIQLGVDYEAIVQGSDDKYAKEILIHRSEVFRLRRKEKFNA